jgi:nitrogen fixation/metabolism regulation signal transduction histidine kinase
MAFKNFHIRVLIRLLLLMISLTLVCYCLVTEHYLRSAYAGALVCILLAEFFFFITRFTRHITAFIQSVQERDFSIRFPENSGDKLFSTLYSSLNNLTALFKKISLEKEIKHRYLETLVSHISFGVISYDEEGKVMLVNQAFLKLSRASHLNTLSQLQLKNSPLFEEIQSLEPGKKKLIKLPVDNQMATLALYATAFKLDEEVFKLVSAQNITNELSATEMEAWQRLIKVLTHEIMNSIAPITSLSGSLFEISSTKTSDPEWGTIHGGLDAIKTRSEGLLNFTQRYRKLTQIPTPEFQTVKVPDFIEHITRLVQPELDKRKIKLQATVQPATSTFDPSLMEQVVINLIQNAMDAVEKVERPQIAIQFQLEDERFNFKIKDNGMGIASNDLDKIFVPFFTTKKNGSGIGLALSRQIILLHGGQISVQSEIGAGTTISFTL